MDVVLTNGTHVLYIGLIMFDDDDFWWVDEDDSPWNRDEPSPQSLFNSFDDDDFWWLDDDENGY